MYGCTQQAQVDVNESNLDNDFNETVDDDFNDTIEDIFVDDDTSNDSSNYVEELKRLVSQSSEYFVVYDYSAEGQSMVMSQYVKGDNMRTDITIMGMETRSYIVDDVFVSCMNQAGEWMCFESDATSADANYTYEVDDPMSDDIDSFDGEVNKLPGRVIAGAQAECFEVIYDDIEYEDAEYIYCYSSGGVPLLMEGEIDSTVWRMVAREFSTTVSNNVFDLPAEVRSSDDLLSAWDVPDY